MGKKEFASQQPTQALEEEGWGREGCVQYRMG